MNCDLYHYTRPFHQSISPAVLVQRFEIIITHKSRQFLVEWTSPRNGKVVIVEVTSANSCVMPEAFHEEIRADFFNQFHIPAHKQTA